MWPFSRLSIFPHKRLDVRSQSYTRMLMLARAEYLRTGGVADLTATVQTCVALWENGLSLAKTDSAILTPEVLALTARSLALTGESVWIIADPLVPVTQWDLTTRDGRPQAYRVSIPDVGGGSSRTVLAGEVLHFRIGCTAATPWRGTSPLRRAALSAGLLNAVEDALSDVFHNAPLGSQIVPMPETANVDRLQLEASFRGKHGRVLLPESTNVTAAGGPAPNSDWKPSGLSPDLKDSMAVETWQAARSAILAVYGVLPALFNPNATGPAVREAQRHLTHWQLTPVAHAIAAEVAVKTLTRAVVDVETPLHAFDAGGRARALGAIVNAMATAKAAGVDPAQVAEVAKFAGIVGFDE